MLMIDFKFQYVHALEQRRFYVFELDLNAKVNLTPQPKAAPSSYPTRFHLHQTSNQ